MSRKHYSTRWDERNVEVQCNACNVFRYGEQYTFGRNLDAYIKEGLAEELNILSNKTVKYSNPDLIELIEFYKKKYPKKIFSLDLSKLTIKPEEISKQLYDFCNLKWNHSVLDFYNRKEDRIPFDLDYFNKISWIKFYSEASYDIILRRVPMYFFSRDLSISKISKVKFCCSYLWKE